MSNPSDKLVYKICPADEWRAAVKQGRFRGSAVDLSDGFIHFSAAHQVQETAAKHFRGQNNLLLIAIAVDKLGDALKWEASRGGDLFPHLYGALDTNLALWEEPLQCRQDGVPIIPERVSSC